MDTVNLIECKRQRATDCDIRQHEMNTSLY